jgi:hypothetical protein
MWDVYRLELEAGRAEPLPEYVSYFALAEKLRIPVHEVPRMHPYWIRAAGVMLEAESIKADWDAAKSKA